MRISDWSSDVCSSDLIPPAPRTRCKAPGAKAGCVSLRQVSLHKQRKVARAVTARKLLILIRLLPVTRRSRAARCARPPHPALRATFSRKREKGFHPAGGRRADRQETGRASWRERVCQCVEIEVVAVSLKQKTKNIIIPIMSYSNRHTSHIIK